MGNESLVKAIRAIYLKGVKRTKRAKLLNLGVGHGP